MMELFLAFDQFHVFHFYKSKIEYFCIIKINLLERMKDVGKNTGKFLSLIFFVFFCFIFFVAYKYYDVNNNEIEAYNNEKYICTNKFLDSEPNDSKEHESDAFNIHLESKGVKEITNFPEIKCVVGDSAKIIDDINKRGFEQKHYKIIFADMTKIIVKNNSYILMLNNSDNNICLAIDLNKLIKDNYTIKEFSVSPNGEYVVIETEDMQSKYKGKIYCCDLKRNVAINISKCNHDDIINTWSYSGNYYVYGDKNGKNIILYDVINNKLVEVPFEKGIIKDIFVSNDGNIIVNSNKKYFINREEKYNVTEINIPGKIINFRDGNVTFYDNGVIYTYNSGKTEEVNKIDEDYNLVKYNGEKAIFSNCNSIMVYSFNTKNIYRYNLKYEDIEYIYFSPNLQRCILMDEEHRFKIITSDGGIYDINNDDFLNYLGEYRWLDNNNIIKLQPIIDTSNNKIKNIEIVKLNIETGEKKSIYKF